MAARHADESVVPRYRQVDEWEQWKSDDDDDVITLIDVNEPSLAGETKLADQQARSKPFSKSPRHSSSFSNSSPDGSVLEHSPIATKPPQFSTGPSTAPGRSNARNVNRPSLRTSKYTMGRITRHSSRKHQKSASSKLRLITDMSMFTRTHHANHLRSPEVKPSKFVDAAALAALEGEPSSASTGNWSWLKRNKLQSPEASLPKQNLRSPQQELSPEDRPIVIGIALPSDEAASREMSPQTVAVGTRPIAPQIARLAVPQPAAFPDENQPKSVWSPDTPETPEISCSFNPVRPTSSIYSQMTMPGVGLGLTNTNVPPVPSLPANFQPISRHRPSSPVAGRSGEDEDDVVGSPCTLFEEDGPSSLRRSIRSMRGKLSAITPSSANSHHGWWDHHVVTPFLDRTMSLASRTQKSESFREGEKARFALEDLRGAIQPTESQASTSPKYQQNPLLPVSVQSPFHSPKKGLNSVTEQINGKEPTEAGLGIERGLLIGFASGEVAPAAKIYSRMDRESEAIVKESCSNEEASCPGPQTDAQDGLNSSQSSSDGDKSQPLAPSQRRVDVPPPYSPPKKQLAPPVLYQAVLPPDHDTNKNTQDASRRTDDGSTRSGEKRGLAGNTLTSSLGNQLGRSNASQETTQGLPRTYRPKAPIQAPEQSRFSLSPTSTSLSTSDGDALSRGRLSLFPARPVGSTLSERFYRDLESAPTRPERSYLAHEPVVPPPMMLGGGSSHTGRHGFTLPLPVRPAGTYLPEHSSARGQTYKVERQRRRHEKEDVTARRVGGFWRGRGCIPSGGCFGRTGREGRKKRRIWMGVIAAIIALLILAVALGVSLAGHDGSEAHSIWVNLTDYPAMPTGVLTFVGPDNTVAKSGCTEPSTLWSCSLPKDARESVLPYKPNQPTVIFQVQWDNSTSNGWKTPNGHPPASIQARDGLDGFHPDPQPPSFAEMWFLGETTDNITSNNKAGEPTPFFISILDSVNDTVATPSLSRRSLPNGTAAGLVPAPELEADGTPKAAVMIPRAVHQPVRLYDRGLPTEHYGFYTYFERTLYLKSVTANQTQANEPLDEDGGCRKAEANYLVTWAQTRMLVQMWTRRLDANTTALLQPGTGPSTLVRPGSMPYPVTVTMDTHGGDPGQKLVWDWPLNGRRQPVLEGAELLANNLAAGGSWINHRGSGDAKYGGFDGGSGGCQCQWVNFV